jgi:hypothetical protein
MLWRYCPASLKRIEETVNRQSIGRENAIALANTKWWVGKDATEVALFQMFTEELCMPFGEFQGAVEKALGRPVFTHEFGLNWDGIAQELLGERSAPTIDEIINLIPAEKRIVITL